KHGDFLFDYFRNTAISFKCFYASFSGIIPSVVSFNLTVGFFVYLAVLHKPKRRIKRFLYFLYVRRIEERKDIRHFFEYRYIRAGYKLVLIYSLKNWQAQTLIL